jgi:Zn-dependent protease
MHSAQIKVETYNNNENFSVERRLDMKCRLCSEEVALPFKCPYCKGLYCSEHRLPENHDCLKKELALAPKKENVKIIQWNQDNFESNIPYRNLNVRRIWFSRDEIKHLVIAELVIMIIGLSTILYQLQTNYVILFAIILMVSFLIHEMAHKIIAKKMGLWAEFQLIPFGLILTLVSIVSPFFKMIYPGTVLVKGISDRKSMGMISLVGPLTNILLCLLFIGIAFSVSQMVFFVGAVFNSWIALFNMIPFGMVDGFKVFFWNKSVWILTFTTSLILVIICYVYIPFF